MKELTIASDCHLYLGNTGTTFSAINANAPGSYHFTKLTVAANGEVTHLPWATDNEKWLRIQVKV